MPFHKEFTNMEESLYSFLDCPQLSLSFVTVEHEALEILFIKQLYKTEDLRDG